MQRPLRKNTEWEIELASLMIEITDAEEIANPNTVKVITDNQGFALYFSRAPIPYQRAETPKAKYFKHKGVYAFRKRALLDFRRLPMQSLEAVEKIEAIRFLEYLASDQAQEYFSAGNDEYPAVPGVALSPSVAALGFFKPDDLDATAIANNVPAAQRLLNATDWE